MNTVRIALLALGSLLSSSQTSSATTYDYNMLYDGSIIALEPGSDVPAGSVFYPGDSFNLNVHTTGSTFWHVNSNYNVFVPLSFWVDEFGSRSVNISTSFRNDGNLVHNITDIALDQSFIHIGSQFWNFAAGLDFDEIALTWSLLSISPLGPTTIHSDPGFFNGFGQNDAPFVKSGKITFTDPQISAVPIPATLPLMATALAAALGFTSRRRKS